MVRGSRSGRWLLKDRRRRQLDGESLADHYQREANPLPRPRKRPARRRPIETVSNGTQSNLIRAVAILSALVTIERAADRALELMGQGRASACEAPAILRLARTLVLEVLPIFRVEFHRPRFQQRLTAEECRDLIDAAVAHALLELRALAPPRKARHEP